ncbi:MAG: DUF4988 domain-containing protein [Bacteroidales bacterium]|nr:DUF4988 domain-containing protein [Bacteroidales bacterium]
MKKILTSVAMVLLLAACTSSYDDSAIKTRLDALETRVTALEGNIQSLQTAIGEGVFVAKVQKYVDPETGKITGVTVTYTTGEVQYFEISPKTDYTAPVLGVIKNGAGDLVWAIDGIAIKIDGNEIPVYQTPVFTIDGDGNLLVSIDGSDPVILGQVQNEGATLVDGIFTDIKVEQDKIVLTLSDNSIVNIPFAEAFKLNIATTEYIYTTPAPIEIPYTVTAKTAGTVVDVWYPNNFAVTVDAEKITVTPLLAKASGQLLVYADSKVGLTSIVKVTVEAEGISVLDTPVSATVDYAAAGNDGVVEANVVSNVAFDVVPVDAWIHLVDVKSTAYVITLALDDNATGAYREGKVNIVKQGTEDVIQVLTIGQAKGDTAKNLGKDGTANCYIVTAAGEYKFVPVKGNTEESVGEVAKAELLWETWNNLDDVVANSVIASVSYENGFIRFTTPETLKPGNALIAAKDANDVILWSWHIWIPKTAITDIADANFSATQSTMSRNLGALVDAATDAVVSEESFGLLYEWGRKDPFPGLASVAEPTAVITVAGTAMTQKEGPVTVDYAIANPTEFVYVAGADWLPAEMTTNSEIATLWGEESKTVYDPCPVGYVLPKRNKSCAFWSGTKWIETTDPFTLFADNKVFTVGSLVFPIAGYIDDGGEGQKKAGLRTIIWSGRWDSGTVNGYGMYGYLDSDGPKFRNQGNVRSRGGSVRCVVEP